MLLFADNFEQYGICNAAVFKDYAEDGLYAQSTVENLSSTGNAAGITDDPDPTAPASSVALHMGAPYGNAKTGVRYAYPGGGRGTIGVAWRWYIAGMPNNEGQGAYMELRDASNLTQVGVRVRTTGALLVYNSAGTSLGETAGPVLTANSWNHIEIKSTISDAAGTFIIYVNGVLVLNLSSIDSKSQASTTTDQLQIGVNHGAGSTGGPTYLKDLIVWDTTGTRNNDIMGPCFVGRFALNSDISLNWTTSSGSTGYSLINETGPNDTTYISAAWPAPSPSTFGVNNLPNDVTSVRAVMLLGRMRKTDGGDCNVRMSFIDAGVDTDGADRPITTADTYWYDILELNTRTSNPFTPTEFNNGTFKINRTL